MKGQTGPRILTSIAILTMIVSGIGFIGMLIANAFFLDEYDKYGEVSIPGSSSLHLDAGEVTVTFHTVLIGGSGSGLPVPPIKYRITGPGGVDTELNEDYGTTTTINNDARVRIGFLHVPTTGTYDIELDGNVSAYLNPSLAFGVESGYGTVPWILAAVFGFAVLDLVIARVWAARVARRPVPIEGFGQSSYGVPTYAPPVYDATPLYDAPPLAQPAASYVPSDQGVRLEQLNTLARLRDSGALTQDEFEAEKKRILES
jgi:hypothetical protein